MLCQYVYCFQCNLMLQLELKKSSQILLQTYARLICQTAVVVNVWMRNFIPLILYGVNIYLHLKTNLAYANYQQRKVFCAILITQT